MMADTNDRRPRKTFEPPPWEREQFEQLERERRRSEPAPESGREAQQVPVPGAQEPKREAPASPAGEQTKGAERDAAVVPEGDSAATDLDEKQVAAMFVQLRAEEPAKDSSLWKLGIAFSGVVAVIGSVLIVWGMAALVRTGGAGPAGTIGGSILLAFGGLFLGLGVWTAVRSLKERGVL